MTPEAIHALLRERFGDAVADWAAPEVGDAFILVDAAQFHDICAFLRDDPATQFDFLRAVSSVDWTDRFGAVYHLYSLEKGHSVTLHADLERERPRIASVADLWPAAEWHEREAFDMMGIVFEGIPNPHRMLLPEDWAGHPLRKDYVAPSEYNGVSNE
jgi:NADH-quinone oxidoreductase subunit C